MFRAPDEFDVQLIQVHEAMVQVFAEESFSYALFRIEKGIAINILRRVVQTGPREKRT